MAYITRKYKLHLNKTQKQQLEVHFGHNRFVWNKLLELNTRAYQDYLDGKQDKKPSINYQSFDLTVTKLKKQYPFLKEAAAVTYQFTTKQLSKAFKSFFKNYKHFSPPKFKRKHSRQSIGYSNVASIHIDFEHRKIKLPKIGWIRIEKHQKPIDLDTTILRQVVITKTVTGKYYISLMFELLITPVKANTSNPNYLGIDLGIKDFAVLSTGEKIENPKYLSKTLKKLRRISKKYSRCKRGSNNSKKRQLQLAKVHEKIKNQRDNFIKQTCAYIVKTIKDNQLSGVAVEDLSVSGMLKNHRLARAISDVGWSKFNIFLEHKTVSNGLAFKKIDRFYPSSQICSNCGYKNVQVKDLSVRTWTCPNCGKTHDRDINAAINIAAYAAQM